MKEYVANILDLVSDDENFNMGSDFGMGLLGQSLKYGMGRSVLIDKNGRLIAGNKTTEKAIECGITKVRVIETDGSELVAVKRMDVDLDSKHGREMALLDNAVSQANLVWNKDNLEKFSSDFGVDVDEWGVFMSQRISDEDFERLLDSGHSTYKEDENVNLFEIKILCDEVDAEKIKLDIEESLTLYSGVSIEII